MPRELTSSDLLAENREAVPGRGGAHARGPVLGERGEHLQADDQVHHRDADRRLRQSTERQGQVLVVLVPRIRHACDRPRSREMLTAALVPSAARSAPPWPGNGNESAVDDLQWTKTANRLGHWIVHCASLRDVDPSPIGPRASEMRISLERNANARVRVDRSPA